MIVSIDDIEMKAGNFDKFFPDRIIIVKKDGSEFADEIIKFLNYSEYDYLSSSGYSEVYFWTTEGKITKYNREQKIKDLGL